MINKQRGLTLVELLIAIAILNIVLAVGYSFNYYVNRSITIASEQAEVQFNVRMASDRIDNIVRLASRIKILQDNTGVAGLKFEGSSNEAEAIYINESGILVHYKDKTSTDLTTGNSEDIDIEITFDKIGNNLLWYTVKGEGNKQSYKITKQLQILNGDEIKKDLDPSTLGKAIIFEQ